MNAHLPAREGPEAQPRPVAHLSGAQPGSGKLRGLGRGSQPWAAAGAHDSPSWLLMDGSEIRPPSSPLPCDCPPKLACPSVRPSVPSSWSLQEAPGTAPQALTASPWPRSPRASRAHSAAVPRHLHPGTGFPPSRTPDHVTKHFLTKHLGSPQRAARHADLYDTISSTAARSLLPGL